MSDVPDAVRPTDEAGPPDAVGKASKAPKVKRPERPPVDPTLKAYFGPELVSSGAFVTAVKNAKIQRFSETDAAEAFAQMDLHDPLGLRLLALVGQPEAPQPIKAWVWSAVQALLRSKVPAAFEVYGVDADREFRKLHEELSPALSADDKDKRRKATTLLLLGLALMVTRRASLDPFAAMELLGETFIKGDEDAGRHVRKALAHGKSGEIIRVSAVAKIARKVVRDALSQRDSERQQRVLVQAQLTDARTEIAELKVLAGDRDTEIRNLQEQLCATKLQLDEKQQHWGHDMVDVKARQAVLLKERVVPLLNDAVDALEIEPAVPHVAIRRLKSALSTIEGSAQ
ncbi:hypothetical protein [Methylobacterium sp. Leaf117]|uniref:hypothetical protein n=1 Tax=Methylobacterium sp. Leaf117 TaxID=1736260 RepID=UPI0006F378D8|nr:hypothetical protein [Methylobacterium sp. Leaf117]KQP91938.1 hypothetical protein ASF57_05510 [Methylobacterium sp. Leaf117]